MLSTLTYVAGFSASKDYASLFVAFKHEHAKHYDSAAAEAQAFKAFSENEDIIASHNAKNLAYKLGHNEYSDLSKDDFWTLHFKPGFDAKKAKPAATSLHVTSNAALPDAVDWVTAGAVTPVKNQGRCGSCWAFSTTGSLEGAYQIASGTLLSLSEEDLVQCDTTDNGCSGGLMDNAFKWVEANGIAAESAYAYTSGGGARQFCGATLRRNCAAQFSAILRNSLTPSASFQARRARATRPRRASPSSPTPASPTCRRATRTP